ncbi:hypothetical protein [Streptomyces sp. NPDC047061]|uniref:hypothetical protein n=1 Tax=Streptomyces sp. NPDC047061 TaxID=3154605 RepID=UPI0033D34B0A
MSVIGDPSNTLARSNTDAAKSPNYAIFTVKQQTEQRASDLVALATRARERLADMTSAEQSEVLALPDVKVTITGAVPKPRVGLVCSMAEWFKQNERLVPDELSDEAWALGELRIEGRVDPRLLAQEEPVPLEMGVPARLCGMPPLPRSGSAWPSHPDIQILLRSTTALPRPEAAAPGHTIVWELGGVHDAEYVRLLIILFAP